MYVYNVGLRTVCIVFEVCNDLGVTKLLFVQVISYSCMIIALGITGLIVWIVNGRILYTIHVTNYSFLIK